MSYLRVKLKLKRHFKHLIDVTQESSGIVVFLHPKAISEYVLSSIFHFKVDIKTEYIPESQVYRYTLFF